MYHNDNTMITLKTKHLGITKTAWILEFQFRDFLTVAKLPPPVKYNNN